MITLRWLTLDTSDNDEGVVTIEALASTPAAQHAAALAEAQAMLAWAWRAFPHTHGPADEGGEWDHDLQVGAEGGRLACRHAHAHGHAGVRAGARPPNSATPSPSDQAGRFTGLSTTLPVSSSDFRFARMRGQPPDTVRMNPIRRGRSNA